MNKHECNKIYSMKSTETGFHHSYGEQGNKMEMETETERWICKEFEAETETYDINQGGEKSKTSWRWGFKQRF